MGLQDASLLSRVTCYLVGLPVLLKAGATVAVVSIVAFVVWRPAIGGTPDEVAAEPVPSFYLEATIMTLLPGSSATDSVSTLRVWYLDRAHWRYELSDAPSAPRATTITMAARGTQMVAHDSRADRYTTGFIVDSDYYPLALPIPLGPVFWPTADEFVGMLVKMRSVGILGEEAVLNRRTTVIELDPPWANYGLGATRGASKIWLDPKSMFVLRAVSLGSDSWVAEVTVLRQDADISLEDVALPLLPPVSR